MFNEVLFLQLGNPKCHFPAWDSLMSPTGIRQCILKDHVNGSVRTLVRSVCWLF